MGTFSAPISIGSPDGRRWESLDALVDTGASIASVPASALRELGVGAHALEGVFMGVDPVGKRLVPVGGWMARA